ncbi:MAG: cation transporter [Clostridia bacterium]|nr:cation transporter [Clostridia bacterium]
MIEALIRRFVPHYERHNDKRVRRAYGMLVSIVGIILNMLLAVGKLLTGIFSGMVSIQADAVNNLSDAGYCLVSMVSFRIAAKPADRDHPYGHARMEYVAGMIVAFLILLIGLDLLRTSALTLWHSVFAPEQVQKSVFSVVLTVVLSLSVLAKLWLCHLNRKIGKRIDSPMMRATAMDSLSDAISTAAVLVAAILEHFLVLPFSLDGLMGIVVSFFILIAGIRILRETQDNILGKAPDAETVENIEKVVRSFEGVYGIHDLCVHQYGAGATVASLHVEVDGKEDVYRTHDMIDNIEQQLLEELQIQATIHMDPIVVGDKTVDTLKEQVAAFAKDIHADITIHDFRIVPGNTHSNLLFDMAVPFEVKLTDEAILAEMDKRLRVLSQGYRLKAKIDRV